MKALGLLAVMAGIALAVGYVEFSGGDAVAEAAPVIADGESTQLTSFDLKNLDDDVLPVASGTWVLTSVESCFDMCVSRCSATCPRGPTCPPNPAGQACSGSYCWDRSSNFARLYICQ